MKKEFTEMKLEIKELSREGEFFILEGIASTPDVDWAGDIVMPDAIKNSVEQFGMPKFMHQHDSKQMPLGAWFDFRVEGSASIFKAQIPAIENDPFTDRLIALINMKAYGGLSIGFYTIDSEWREDVRIIKELQLIEVSLVTIPCNRFAEVLSCKSRELGVNEETILKMQKQFDELIDGKKSKSVNRFEKLDNLRDIEEGLKNAGLSRKEAQTVISVTKSTLRDSEQEEQKDLNKSDDPQTKENKASEDLSDSNSLADEQVVISLKELDNFFQNLVKK